MIARSAQGSFRDALGTLDQLVAFGGNDVGLDEVLEMLGAADADLLFEAVDSVTASDPKAVLLGVEKMARSGRDPSQFARDLLAHLRHLLVTQTTGEVPTTFVVTATDTARIQQQATTVGAATLVRTIDELAERPDRGPRGRRRAHGRRDRPAESRPPRPRPVHRGPPPEDREAGAAAGRRRPRRPTPIAPTAGPEPSARADPEHAPPARPEPQAQLPSPVSSPGARAAAADARPVEPRQHRPRPPDAAGDAP